MALVKINPNNLVTIIHLYYNIVTWTEIRFLNMHAGKMAQ